MSAILPIGPAARIAGPYTASAGQTSFSFAFALLDAGDLTVETAPAADPDNWSPATYGAEWSIPTTLPTVTGGSIVFALGRAAGTRVRIVGSAAIANTQDPLPGGRVESGLLNRFFDRTTIWAQEARRDIGAALALLKTSANGWTPIEAVESYGERRVRKIVDWVGGIGAKPAVNRYVGPAGLTANVAQAVDIRGAAGGGVKIVGTVAAVEDLPASGVAGDAWVVGENLYAWSALTLSWTNLGPLMEGTLETSNHIGLTSVDIDDRSIPAPVVNLQSTGYASPGDGGAAQWRSVNTEPSHPGKRPSLFGRWWEIANDYLTPQQFGVFDDPGLTVDQSARIQDWLDTCMALNVVPRVKRPLRAVISQGVSYIPFNDSYRTLHIDMSMLTLRPDFDGGMKIGAVNTFINSHTIYVPQIQRIGALTWEADDWEGNGDSIFSDKAGLIVYNAARASIHVQTIAGFTKGAVYHSENYWFAYSKIFINGELRDCRFNEVMRTVRGTINNGEFANENTIYGGRRGQSSSTNALGAAFGTVIAAKPNAYSGNNTNRFREACYEMGASGSAWRVPVLLWGSGTKNRWENARHEAGVGPFGIAHARGRTTARENSCTIQLRGALVTEHRGHDAGWLQIGGAYDNTDQSHDIVRPVWNSGPMARLLESSGGVGPRIAAPWFFKPSGGGAPFRSLTTAAQAVTNRRALQLGSNVMAGVEIDTARIKTWRITPAGLTGFQGRYVVQAYGTPETWAPDRPVVAGHHQTNDSGKVYRCTVAGTTASSGGPTGTGGTITDGTATWTYAGVLADFPDGAQLCGVTTDSYGTEQWVKGGIGPTTIYGGSYIAPSDGIRNGIVITVRAEVTRIHVGIASGTNPAAITGLTLEAFPTYSLPDSTAFNLSTITLGDPLPLAQGRRVVTAKPDTAGVHGFYEAGEIVSHSTQASGQPVIDICTTSGALASPWVGNTLFVVPGHCVLNDTDKIYELASSAGPSASSGGPTGTGKGIVDGGCVWNYIGTKAAFAALVNMP